MNSEESWEDVIWSYCLIINEQILIPENGFDLIVLFAFVEKPDLVFDFFSFWFVNHTNVSQEEQYYPGNSFNKEKPESNYTDVL